MNTSIPFAQTASKEHHIHLWTAEGNTADISIILEQLQKGFFQDTHIIYWAAEEWTCRSELLYRDLPAFRDALLQQNAYITFVLGSHRCVHHADTYDPLHDAYGDGNYDNTVTAMQLDYYCSNVTVVHYPNWFMYQTACSYLAGLTGKDKNLTEWMHDVTHKHREAEPKKLWTTLIGECWYHRTAALDIFANKGVMPYGSVILNNTKTALPQFKHWDKSNLVRTADEEVVDQYGMWPDEYTDGVIDVVIETNSKVRFTTEKTWRPIFYGKPYVVLGGRNSMTAMGELWGLESAGSEFVCKWDQYKTFEDRAKGCADWLMKLHMMHGHDLHNLRNKLNFTCDHNKNSINVHLKNMNRPDFVKRYAQYPLSCEYSHYDKTFSGCSGFADYVDTMIWERRQAVADKLTQERGSEVNSAEVPWLL